MSTRKIPISTKLFSKICISLIFLFAGFPSQAEENYQTEFSIVISEVRTVSVDNQSIGIISAADSVISGWTQKQSLSVNVSANVDWVLSISGSDEYWDAPWQKPVGDIFWSYNGSDYIPLSVTPSEVMYGGPVDSGLFNIDFKISLDPLNDIPGDYSYPEIIIELNAP